MESRTGSEVLQNASGEDNIQSRAVCSSERSGTEPAGDVLFSA